VAVRSLRLTQTNLRGYPANRHLAAHLVPTAM
jgi:hypothetical protein